MGLSFERIVFGLAVAFSIRTLIHPDFVSALGLIVWLSGFFIDRFFSAFSFEQKARERLDNVEASLKETKEYIQNQKLANSVRGVR